MPGIKLNTTHSSTETKEKAPVTTRTDKPKLIFAITIATLCLVMLLLYILILFLCIKKHEPIRVYCTKICSKCKIKNERNDLDCQTEHLAEEGRTDSTGIENTEPKSIFSNTNHVQNDADNISQNFSRNNLSKKRISLTNKCKHLTGV